MRVRRRGRRVGSWYEGCRWLLLLNWRLTAVCPLLLWLLLRLCCCLLVLLVSELLRLLVSLLQGLRVELIRRVPGVAGRPGGLVPLLLELWGLASDRFPTALGG